MKRRTAEITDRQYDIARMFEVGYHQDIKPRLREELYAAGFPARSFDGPMAIDIDAALAIFEDYALAPALEASERFWRIEHREAR